MGVFRPETFGITPRRLASRPFLRSVSERQTASALEFQLAFRGQTSTLSRKYARTCATRRRFSSPGVARKAQRLSRRCFNDDNACKEREV